MTDIRTKRERLKAILTRQYDRAQQDGRTSFANLIYGMMLRADVGRYDEQLDAMILQLGSDAA